MKYNHKFFDILESNLMIINDEISELTHHDFKKLKVEISERKKCSNILNRIHIPIDIILSYFDIEDFKPLELLWNLKEELIKYHTNNIFSEEYLFIKKSSELMDKELEVEEVSTTPLPPDIYMTVYVNFIFKMKEILETTILTIKEIYLIISFYNDKSDISLALNNLEESIKLITSKGLDAIFTQYELNGDKVATENQNNHK